MHNFFLVAYCCLLICSSLACGVEGETEWKARQEFVACCWPAVIRCLSVSGTGSEAAIETPSLVGSVVLYIIVVRFCVHPLLQLYISEAGTDRWYQYSSCTFWLKHMGYTWHIVTHLPTDILRLCKDQKTVIPIIHRAVEEWNDMVLKLHIWKVFVVM